MCLIICQPEGREALPREWFHNGWSHNDDGAGYMFAANGKLVIRKPFYRLRDFRRAYYADHAVYGDRSPFVLHFRWATHGSRKVDNIHPHSLAGGKVGLVHNGILFDFTPPKELDISDTAFFCRTVLTQRQPAQLISTEFGKVLAEMVGKGNKLVLMDNTGDVSIVNEEEGVWEGGIWCSNHGYACEYKPTHRTARGLVFPVHESLWDQATTQEDVWEGVDADSLDEEEWEELAEEQAWREAKAAMLRDGV